METLKQVYVILYIRGVHNYVVFKFIDFNVDNSDVPIISHRTSKQD
jgi:hypothetical protein